MKEIGLEWQEYELSSVMNYFIKYLKPREGEEIMSVDYFIDTAQKKVVLRIMVRKSDSK